MSKYDDAKKGARFTMCQAALQGGADVSIVPKVMDYVETGNVEALRYVSPCEVMEKELKDTSAKYEELRDKRDELKLALDALEKEYNEVKEKYRTLLKEAYEFQSEMRSEMAELYNVVPDGSAMTISSVVTALAGIKTPSNKRVYVQIGEYLIAANAIKMQYDKPIIVAGGSDDTNPCSIYRVLPDGALESTRNFEQGFEKLHDQLGMKMTNISAIDRDYRGIPERFFDGKKCISVTI